MQQNQWFECENLQLKAQIHYSCSYSSNCSSWGSAGGPGGTLYTAAVGIAHWFVIGFGLGLAKGGQKLTICTAGEIFHKGIVKSF